MAISASPQLISRLFVAYNRYTSSASNLLSPLRFKIAAIVDLITYRLPSKGVESTFESLKSDLFDTRMEVIYAFDKPEILKRLLSDLSFEKRDNALSQLVAECTYIYSIIAESFHFSAKLPSEKLTYESLSALRFIAPSTETENMLAFIDDSLAMELGFMAAEISFETDTLAPFQTDIKRFLRLSFERFAARAAIMGMWEPDELPETPLLRNIKIVASRYQSQKRETLTPLDLLTFNEL